MAKAEETRTRIIEQAATLFNQQGYAGASMSDLMRVTGLQKGGIYNHFRSKDDLALAAFDFAVSHLQQKFRQALQGKRHAVERLLAILAVYEHLLADPQLQGGCPLLNTAVESDDTHPLLRERTQRAMDSWQVLLRRIITQGRRRGDLHSSIDPETVTIVLITTIEGAIMLSKLYGDESYLQRALTYLKTYVQNLQAAPS
uniref:Transcriptional regulator, TetR family n=1 Tax=Cyanothece sp. (strain PCC 7425 / ATCC 29141) TaxID=395961 RepID=B8HR70_CYAP4